MYETYTRIFTRLGLSFRAVAADPGAIGGTGSHEFHVLAASGEDAIAYCPASDYAANVELAEALTPGARASGKEPMQKVSTPGTTKCEAVAQLLGVPLARTVKAIAVMHHQRLCLLLLRGDHDLNEVKVTKIEGLSPFRFATDDEITEHLGCPPGYIGPVALANTDIRVIADRTVANMSDFVCGANEEGFHFNGVNFGRDLPEPELVADIRNVIAGDPSPDGMGTLEICRGIEVGHIFQLRTKYSEAFKCTFLDEAGQPQLMEMGCYGIGVSRIVGAAIEQGHDSRGIVFPEAMAPFQVVIIPVGYHKSATVRSEADRMYEQLATDGIDVVLDDRDERPGVMFSEWELIGIPHRVVIGERSLKEGRIEYQGRTEVTAIPVAIATAHSYVRNKLCN